MFFRKGEKTLLWNTLFESKAVEIDIKDYLVPAIKNIPSWFKESPSIKKKINPLEVGRVKSCPSFIELFKNSLLFVSPCDFILNVSRHGWEINATSSDLIAADSHTEIRGRASQMGSGWDRNLINIKLVSSLFLKPNKGKIKAIVVPSYYYNPKSEIQAGVGILDFHPSTTLSLNLNCFVDISDLNGSGHKSIEVKCGDPLAMYYFPEGIPVLKKSDIKMSLRKHTNFNYANTVKNYEKNKEKKCPFS